MNVQEMRKLYCSAGLACCLSFGAAASFADDIGLEGIDHLIYQEIAYFDGSRVPVSIADALGDVDLARSAERLDRFYYLQDSANAPHVYAPASHDGDQLNTAELWRKAAMVADALDERCAFWRDNVAIGDVGDGVSAEAVDARLSLLEAGTWLGPPEAREVTFRVSKSDVAFLVDQNDQMIQGITDALTALPSSDDIGAWEELDGSISQFHAGIADLCPAP
jgi:hypothetical protein